MLDVQLETIYNTELNRLRRTSINHRQCYLTQKHGKKKPLDCRDILHNTYSCLQHSYIYYVNLHLFSFHVSTSNQTDISRSMPKYIYFFLNVLNCHSVSGTRKLYYNTNTQNQQQIIHSITSLQNQFTVLQQVLTVCLCLPMFWRRSKILNYRPVKHNNIRLQTS